LSVCRTLLTSAVDQVVSRNANTSHLNEVISLVTLTNGDADALNWTVGCTGWTTMASVVRMQITAIWTNDRLTGVVTNWSGAMRTDFDALSLICVGLTWTETARIERYHQIS